VKTKLENQAMRVYTHNNGPLLLHEGGAPVGMGLDSLNASLLKSSQANR